MKQNIGQWNLLEQGIRNELNQFCGILNKAQVDTLIENIMPRIIDNEDVFIKFINDLPKLKFKGENVEEYQGIVIREREICRCFINKAFSLRQEVLG
jgi:hypothetical protein